MDHHLASFSLVLQQVASVKLAMPIVFTFNCSLELMVDAASKSALHYGFLLSLKNEIVKIHPKGRANVVAPGWVRCLGVL